MVLPLPSALSEFSKIATSAIKALSAIQEAIKDPQAIVQKNITTAATAVATKPGELYQDAPTAIDSSNGNFLAGITSPKSLDIGAQQVSAGDLFGTDLTTGTKVDDYLNAKVSVGDVLPSQQIYQFAQNLSVTSLFADPLQAYTHVATISRDINNLCLEAASVITQIQSDLTNLLTVQTSINYAQYAQMGPAFFASALEKVTLAIGQHSILCTQLQVRGRYDPTSVTALCSALDEISNLLMFSNTKVTQFDLLRQSATNGLNRLRQIGRDLIAVLKGATNFVPKYVDSTSFGKIFQAVQGKVCAQAGADLGKIKKDIQAFMTINADDKAKAGAANSMASAIQTIKAFMCGLQPASSVVDPGGPFGDLKSSYDTLTASLSFNDPTGFLETIEDEINSFLALMNTGVTKDNTIELSAGVSSIGAAIAGLLGSVSAISTSCTAFKTAFKTQTQTDPDRTVGAVNLYERIGADNARSTTLLNAGDSTQVAIAESTSLGQLAESIKTVIADLPAGNEQDQMILLHSQVQAKHRAVVLAMDFTRREDIRTFFAPDVEEENRQLVNKTAKTYSKIPRTEFDNVTTV